MVTAAPAQKHATGSCLAGVCLDGKRPSEKEWIRRFGDGSLGNSGSARCYSLPDRGLFLVVGMDVHRETDREIEFIQIGKEQWLGCDQSTTPKAHFETLATTEGLEIGDPEAKAIRLYASAPAFEVDHREDGTARILFGPCAPDCSLLTTAIEIRNGRVWSIGVSDAE